MIVFVKYVILLISVDTMIGAYLFFVESIAAFKKQSSCSSCDLSILPSRFLILKLLIIGVTG